MSDTSTTSIEGTAQLWKRNWIDESGQPVWGEGPDGRMVSIKDDTRLPALFKAWLADACRHPVRIIAQHDDSLGRPQYFEFCESCGMKLSTAIAHSKIAKLSEISGPELLARNENYNAERKTALDKITAMAAERCQIGNRESYDDYLRSPAWQRRREKVMSRAGYVCEGCLTNKASEVHHLSYANKGAEFAFELVALCGACHDRWHRS